MRIEMKPGEQEILREMLGGAITPACAQLYGRIRRRLLLVGHNYDMPKETLAIIAELSDAVTKHSAEPTEKRNVDVETNGHSDPTPVDEVSTEERDQMEAENQTLNGDATGGEYKGNRIKWASDFTSTPKTPIAKLEKGRPISYVSPKDGQRRAGRFVRINTKDKRLANIESGEMKKAFPVPIKNIEITDLSRPSTDPLAVQI